MTPAGLALPLYAAALSADRMRRGLMDTDTLDVSYDSTAYEVPAQITADSRLSPACAREACRILDTQGFVVVPGALSDEETAAGRRMVQETLDDPDRQLGTFASQTDMRYRRRAFAPLPTAPEVMSFAALTCKRLGGILLEYSGRSRAVLEISTLTSYIGSSHQYIHRDPSGIICIFAALEDVSPEQGGTVFVPATHHYNGGGERHGGRAGLYMDLFQVMTNMRVLRHNLFKLLRMRKQGLLAPGEFEARVFSRTQDNHQPNLMRFLAARNSVFDVSKIGPRTLWRWFRSGRAAEQALRLVQVAPKKGTVILYRSDILHAGPDNRSEKPRVFFSMSIARDVIGEHVWRDGYSPHATLVDDPKTLGDLLDSPSK